MNAWAQQPPPSPQRNRGIDLPDRGISKTKMEVVRCCYGSAPCTVVAAKSMHAPFAPHCRIHVPRTSLCRRWPRKLLQLHLPNCIPAYSMPVYHLQPTPSTKSLLACHSRLSNDKLGSSTPSRARSVACMTCQNGWDRIRAAACFVDRLDRHAHGQDAGAAAAGG